MTEISELPVKLALVQILMDGEPDPNNLGRAPVQLVGLLAFGRTDEEWKDAVYRYIANNGGTIIACVGIIPQSAIDPQFIVNPEYMVSERKSNIHLVDGSEPS